MSLLKSGKTPKVFSIQVSGIKCTNCAGKIKKGLGEGLNDPETKIAVNIIQEKVSLTVFKDSMVQKAVEILIQIGFPPIGEPVPISGGQDNQRVIAFFVDNKDHAKLLEGKLENTLGIQKLSLTPREKKCRVNVTYNCQIIKGKELAAIIGEVDSNYKVINDRIDSFTSKQKVSTNQVSIVLTIVLCLYFFIINMVVPIFVMDQMWYNDIITYPSQLGVYSISVIINFILTIYVMIRYGKTYVVRAVKNYCQFGVTNMETLIALGCTSAFALFLFFMGKYTAQYINDQLTEEMEFAEAIMEINDSLTSSSIIVLVVTVGKYFETKAKENIVKMTQQIFPESILFKNMEVKYVEIKNRQLKIVDEKMMDVSLVEKNDVIRPAPGRLLLDAIIIQGEVTAMQSARTGCEDIVILKKGDRLESGSEIIEVKDCLAIVQNVLEKSLLIEIGTQVKHAQNQEEGEESGIQALCKTIASYFVKGVIILSLLTILTWSLLLSFLEIEVPMCDICWIVERGIGVLVASCPCALGLAVPSVIAIILNLATKSGILIKNNGVFQKMKISSVIAFDKTGTLFTRLNKIQDYASFSTKYSEAKLWQIIALIEKEIRHPLAQILYKEAFTRAEISGTNFGFILLDKPQVQKEGISVKILEKTEKQELHIFIGNKNILINNGMTVPPFRKRTEAATEIFLAVQGQPEMVIMLNTHANLRPEAKDVIEKIKGENFDVHILSGDSAASVEKLGYFLDIPIECQHPEQSTFMKMKWIKDEQRDGTASAIMIGDGLNDIPCLQEAGIGISINAKSELNINAADVVILSQNLYKILALIRFLKRGNLFINLNLLWAFAYNIVMMPMVTGALFPFGITISPVWSAIAMSLSSLFVVGFSHLLSCFEYDESLRSERGLDLSIAPQIVFDKEEPSKPLFNPENTECRIGDEIEPKYN